MVYYMIFMSSFSFIGHFYLQ